MRKKGELRDTGTDLLARINAQVKGVSYPPVHLWHPDFCGEIDMRIARDGSWYYMGTPIGRPAMVKLFSSVLRLDDDGVYYLVTPVEKLAIRVDDAPLFVVAATREGDGKKQNIRFRTKTDDVVIADQDHPMWVDVDPNTDEPSPYVHIRAGLNALIARSVFYDLVNWAVPAADDPHRLGLWSGGVFFDLGAFATGEADD